MHKSLLRNMITHFQEMELRHGELAATVKHDFSGEEDMLDLLCGACLCFCGSSTRNYTNSRLFHT